jgi:hypothetical protein
MEADKTNRSSKYSIIFAVVACAAVLAGAYVWHSNDGGPEEGVQLQPEQQKALQKAP